MHLLRLILINYVPIIVQTRPAYQKLEHDIAILFDWWSQRPLMSNIKLVLTIVFLNNVKNDIVDFRRV